MSSSEHVRAAPIERAAPPSVTTKGATKRDEILRAALQVCSTQGYDRTSVREIARSVGLSQAGLLHHFGSKEQLFVEVLRRRMEHNIRDYGQRDPVATLIAILRHNMDVPGLVRLSATLSAEATDVDHPAHDFFVTRYRGVRDDLSTAIRAAQQTGEFSAHHDPEQVASVLVAVADGLQIQWLLDPSHDVAAGVELVWRSMKTCGSASASEATVSTSDDGQRQSAPDQL